MVVTGGSLNVGAAASLGGTLNVVGASTLSNTTVIGSLNVTGSKISINSTSAVNDSISLSASSGCINLGVTGAGQFNAMTANSGSTNYMNAYTGAANNNIDNRGTGNNFIRGATIFNDYATPSAVSITNTNGMVVTTTTDSISATTGSLQVRGGLGVSGNVYARAYYATSDSRVKTNVTNINIQSLDVLRKIQPRKYDHIDTQSSEPTYGFVAQEVKKILPNAVSFRSDYIPSVHEIAFIDNRTITLINKSTTDISMCDIKLLDNKRNEIISRVIEISNDKTFIIDKPISDFITYKTDVSGNILTFTIRQGKMIYMRGSEEYTGLVKKGIFVYGTQVDDFHTLDKDTIWTVTLTATKELDIQLQEAKLNIAEQDIRIADLEQTVRRQQADIDAIKLRLG